VNPATDVPLHSEAVGWGVLHQLWLPKTPSELKTRRFRAFVRSWWYHDELSFRRPFRSGCLPVFEPVPPCRRRFSRSVTNSQFSKRTRRLACASSAPTGSCGFCYRDGGLVGAIVCTSFAPIRLLLGTAERSLGTGRGNHGDVREERTWPQTFAT
jgi:hypothetical protein